MRQIKNDRERERARAYIARVTTKGERRLLTRLLGNRFTGAGLLLIGVPLLIGLTDHVIVWVGDFLRLDWPIVVLTRAFLSVVVLAFAGAIVFIVALFSLSGLLALALYLGYGRGEPSTLLNAAQYVIDNRYIAKNPWSHMELLTGYWLNCLQYRQPEAPDNEGYLLRKLYDPAYADELRQREQQRVLAERELEQSRAPYMTAATAEVEALLRGDKL